MEVPMLVTAILTPALDGGFTAFNPESGSASQGETVSEAIDNLREAVELYIEAFPTALAGCPLVMSFAIGA
jgi:predicted RNase H-like HicB family nuclease